MRLHPPFPRPSSVFVGRAEPLRRASELLPTEVLFLVYGIAGIGKSEFIYQLVAAAQRTPGLSQAKAILLKAQCGQTGEEFVAELFQLLQPSEPRLYSQRGPEEWAKLVRLLDDEAQPLLLCLDDLHLLTQGAEIVIGELVGYLSRHVRVSRMFVGARSELPLPFDAPIPVVLRLPPLTSAESAQLVDALLLRLGPEAAILEDAIDLCLGSPLLIRRALLRSPDLVETPAPMVQESTESKWVEADDGGAVCLSQVLQEVIAHVDRDELVLARTLVDHALFQSAMSRAGRGTQGGASLVSSPMLLLLRGVLWCAQGELTSARTALAEALPSFEAQRDSAMAAIAGCYLGQALLGLGDLAGAAAMRERFAMPEFPRASEEAGLARVYAADLQRAERWIELTTAVEPGLAAVVEQTEQALSHYAACGRRYEEARAALALSWLLLGHGKPSDLARADEALGRAQELSSRNAYGLLHLRGLLLEAALQRHHGNERRVLRCLRQGVDDAGAEQDGLEARLLRAALHEIERQPGESAEQSPQVDGLLSLLGLRSVLPFEIVDRSGRREADEEDRLDAICEYELLIEPERGLITRGGAIGGSSIVGRPLLASLLAVLLSAPSEGATAERLFYEVWGGRDYHPLQHRNTIYVAIGRLRQALRELLPGREIIETALGGWRLADSVRVCVIRKQSRDRVLFREPPQSPSALLTRAL